MCQCSFHLIFKHPSGHSVLYIITILSSENLLSWLSPGTPSSWKWWFSACLIVLQNVYPQEDWKCPSPPHLSLIPFVSLLFEGLGHILKISPRKTLPTSSNWYINVSLCREPGGNVVLFFRRTWNSLVSTCSNRYRVWQKEHCTGRIETYFLVLTLLPKISFVTLDNSPHSGLLLPPWQSQGLVWEMSKVTFGPNSVTMSGCIFLELPACVWIFVPR